MTISIEQKNGSLKTYSSVDEMMKSIDEEEKARPIWKKILDYIDYKIIYNIVNIFHPCYNINRIKWLYQRLTRGWDNRELWSLDHIIAVRFYPYIQILADDPLDNILHVSEFKRTRKSFEFIVREWDSDIKKLGKELFNTEDYKEINQHVQDGLDDINKKFFNLDPRFIKEFAYYVHPRLKEFDPHGVPTDFCYEDEDCIIERDFKEAEEDWSNTIAKMTNAFEKLKDYDINKERFDIFVIEGVNLFFTHFRSLWD